MISLCISDHELSVKRFLSFAFDVQNNAYLCHIFCVFALHRLRLVLLSSILSRQHRLVLQDGIDLLHDLWRELGQNIKCDQVVKDLLGSRSSELRVR